MKVTLSNTITCKLIFRVQGVDPVDGNMRRTITGIMAYTVYFVKWRRISENGNRKRKSTEKEIKVTWPESKRKVE